MSHHPIPAEEQKYLVYNKKEILNILNELSKKKSMINVSFNHGNENFLTTIISVDDSKQLAYLDLGRDESFNERLLASHDACFSNNDGIKIHWSNSHLKLATLKDGKALCIGLPNDFVRVQRREYFRLTTPGGKNPIICRIPVPNEDQAEEEVEHIELALFDVSVGGIGLVAQDPMPSYFSIGAHFDNCKIEFPGVGTTNLTLCVRNIRHTVMKNESVQHRIGMEFINPSRGNQSLIQRYTFILETESLTGAI